MGVESHETGIGRTGVTTVGFCMAQQDRTKSLWALLVGMVLSLEVLYDMLLRLLDESVDTGTGIDMLVEGLSKSKLFRLSVQRRENLLKCGYFSECLAAALANILRKNLHRFPWATCLAQRSVAPLQQCPCLLLSKYSLTMCLYFPMLWELCLYGPLVAMEVCRSTVGWGTRSCKQPSCD